MTTVSADLEHLRRAEAGQFDWGWLRDTKSEWGVKAQPGKVGLTMRDLAVGSYGEVPDHPLPAGVEPVRGMGVQRG